MISFMRLSLRGWAVVLQCAEARSRTHGALTVPLWQGDGRAVLRSSVREFLARWTEPRPRETRAAPHQQGPHAPARAFAAAAPRERTRTWDAEDVRRGAARHSRA